VQGGFLTNLIVTVSVGSPTDEVEILRYDDIENIEGNVTGTAESTTLITVEPVEQ